jgi:flagellar FliJ protein
MKFKFKLDKILRHRQILEDLAQREFQEVNAELNRQISILENFRNEKSEARKRSFALQNQTGGQVLESLKQIHDFIVLQDIRIEKQIKVIEEHEKLVEAKREVLRQKAMDTKIIKRLEEKKKQQFMEEQQKLEQKELDDNSSMRFEILKKMKEQGS